LPWRSHWRRATLLTLFHTLLLTLFFLQFSNVKLKLLSLKHTLVKLLHCRSIIRLIGGGVQDTNPCYKRNRVIDLCHWFNIKCLCGREITLFKTTLPHPLVSTCAKFSLNNWQNTSYYDYVRSTTFIILVKKGNNSKYWIQNLLSCLSQVLYYEWLIKKFLG